MKIFRCFSVPKESAIPTNASAAHLTAYKNANEDITRPEDLRVKITTTV